MSAPETATWCVARGGYADETCGPDHAHYDVEYDAATGRVLTDREEQRRRRIAVSDDDRLWREVHADIVHAAQSPTGSVGRDLREHPAMVELLRRERERA